MEYASDAYKQAMQQNIRGESYVWVTLDLVNTYAQESAYISSSFSGTEEGIYDDSPVASGVVSSENDGSITFTFGEFTTLLLNGVRVQLGATGGTVTATNGTVSETVSVTDPIVPISKVFSNCHYIKLTPSSGNLNVKKVWFGVPIEFDNHDIMDTHRKNTVKHLNDELPLKEFSFSVHNYDRMWNKDNPSSLARFLHEKQKVTYKYGRQIDENDTAIIEGGVAYLNSWTSDDYKAKFSCVGLLDYLQGEYKKGQFYSDGITLYQLAEFVMIDAGITKYELDACLRTFKVTNPLPVDTHKACLQMIAHAGGCILFEDRNGAVCIKSANRPEIYREGTVINGTSFSNDDDVVNSNTVSNYGSSEPDYTYADGLQFFYPSDDSVGTLPVGFVSQTYADSNGNLSPVPKIQIKFSSIATLDEIIMNCAVAPKDMSVEAYLGTTLVDTQSITNNTQTQISLTYNDLKCDKIEVTVTKTAPGQRVHINSIDPVGSVDYEITYHDIVTTPVATSLDKVSDIIVQLYSYTEMKDEGTSASFGQPSITYTELESGGLQADITSGEGGLMGIEVVSGINYIDLTSVAKVTSVEYNDGIEGGTATILETGAYYIKVDCSRDGTVVVKGDQYMQNIATYTINVNEIGNPVRVNNPLISTAEHVEKLKSNWLNYYSNDVEYQLSYRGDPVIDADDCIYLENKFVDKNYVRIESEELSTSGGMDVNNQLIARRISYKERS